MDITESHPFRWLGWFNATLHTPPSQMEAWLSIIKLGGKMPPDTCGLHFILLDGQLLALGRDAEIGLITLHDVGTEQSEWQTLLADRVVIVKEKAPAILVIERAETLLRSSWG